MTAQAIAAEVREGRRTAADVVSHAVERAHSLQPELNAFTTIADTRAAALAHAVDEAVARGDDPGPLAGVPFAVKDLYDLEGVATAAGSTVLLDRGPALRDADAVARLIAAGAVPIGALVMDEFAFGFTTENSHYGSAHNPHDLTRTAGGSSGGSAAAVAAGVVPLTLGSDTNGSIRVPASLCGVFGLKPTYGAVSRRGMQLFSDSLDHVGAFAASARDLAAAFDVLADTAESCEALPERPRVGVLRGWFADHADPQATEAVELVAGHFERSADVVLDLAEAAHAAASVITYAEAGELHLDRIRYRRSELDPVVRHRLVAGALLPADWYLRAQRLRSVWSTQVTDAFERFDLLVAPATPFPAPRLGTETVEVNGKMLPARPAVGWLTQPLTPAGVPIGAAPVWCAGAELPIGVQVIAPVHKEGWVLEALASLEDAGMVECRIASTPGAPSRGGTDDGDQ